MRSRVFIWCCLALALSVQPAAAGTILIKADEAALPAAAAASKLALVTRGITRRPNVVLMSPEASVTSPFNLKFDFRAHGGSKIKPDSFKVIYLKNPTVDLTARVSPYVTASGVSMVGAEAPPGQHVIEVKIADSDDRETTAVFVLNVLK
jgi:hypothetical protein